MVGLAVLGQPVKIQCLSTGSLPINYTLLRDSYPVSSINVKLPSQKAIFNVRITRNDELNTYKCKAKNRPQESRLSRSLNHPVIGKWLF